MTLKELNEILDEQINTLKKRHDKPCSLHA